MGKEGGKGAMKREGAMPQESETGRILFEPRFTYRLGRGSEFDHFSPEGSSSDESLLQP